MGNTVSLPLFQEKKKSGYGHLPYFLLKLHQALIKNVLFVEPEIIPRRHLCLCDGDAHHGQEISNFRAKPEVTSKFLHWQLLHVTEKQSSEQDLEPQLHATVCKRKFNLAKGKQEPSPNRGQNAPA